MSYNFEPWVKYPPLLNERLVILACLIRDARKQTVALHKPDEGDNEWSLGCRVYARTTHGLKRAVEQFDWLTILPEHEKPLRFTFAVGSVPIRFYRGEAGDPPGHYVSVSYAELYQQQLAFQIDGIRLVDQILRLAVEVDSNRNVSGVYLVELDMQGSVTETYKIPFEQESGTILPIQLKPIDVAPPEIEVLEKPDKKKLKDGYAGSK
jgi:hypothetical protein